MKKAIFAVLAAAGMTLSFASCKSNTNDLPNNTAADRAYQNSNVRMPNNGEVTDRNGKLTITFSGLVPGRYRLYEVIGNKEYAWNSNVKVDGVGSSKITMVFMDENGAVLEADGDQNENDIVLTNTTYYMYFETLAGLTDDFIKLLITKARSGTGKKFVIGDEASYLRAYALNESIPNVTERATILHAGVNGPKYDMPSDFATMRQISTLLANSTSSSSVKIIESNGVDDINIGKDDGRLIVINVVGSNRPNVKTFYLDEDGVPHKIGADFNHSGMNWSSKIIYNMVEGPVGNRTPYTGDINTLSGTTGVLLAPSASVYDLGENWGGTIVCAYLEHSGSEIHSEQWDEDIDIGKTAVKNIVGEIKTNIDLYAAKQYNNWGDSDSFTFILKNVNGSPMPKNAVEVNGVKQVSVDVNEDKIVGVFGRITFTENGEYEYIMQEVIPDEAVNKNHKQYSACNEDEKTGLFTLNNISYDATPRYITVKAEDGVASYTITKASETSSSVQDNEVVITFINTYTNGQAYCVAIVKKWNDDNNRDGVRPASIFVELHQKITKAVYAFLCWC